MKNTKKKIKLIISFISSVNGEKIGNPEDVFYWRRPKGKVVEVDFVARYQHRYISLYNRFFIPREFTELVKSEHYDCGYAIKFSDSIYKLDYINTIDCSKYRDIWSPPIEDIKDLYDPPRPLTEIQYHMDTLMNGWLRLISIWHSDNSPDVIPEIYWWENYLKEEIYGFPYLYRQTKNTSIKEVFKNPVDKTGYKKWLRIASCCVELLTSKPLLLTLQLDKGKDFPCLWNGYKEMIKREEIEKEEKNKQEVLS